MANKTIKYEAEPTAAKVHRDREHRVIYISGPFGSGKSTCCIMEIIMRAMEQQPDDQKIRKSRWAIVRNTYPELKSTTIKTWQEWVPSTIAPITYSIPINCRFKQKLSDGTIMDLEVFFMALDSPEDVSKLLSLELTGAYINEGREIPQEIMDGLLGRINRYPRVEYDDEGNQTYGASRPGVLIDSNPPRTTHWLYTMFQPGAIPKDWVEYKQPPAVFWDDEEKVWVCNPDAENLKHLSKDYYQQQLSSSEEHIKVNLAGEYGMTRLGKPVFSKFSSTRHVAKEILIPKRGLALLLGIDFGLTPACVFGQLTYTGIELLEELPATDESLEDFLDAYIIPILRNKYAGYKVIACGDPAGGGRSSINKMTSIQVVQQRGITCVPAVTNAFLKRKEAVDFFLGRDKGFLLDPRLTFLIEALSAGYVWKEAKNSKGQVLEIANKNDYSHIADATQYLALYARYGGGSLARPESRGVPATASRSRYLWA